MSDLGSKRMKTSNRLVVTDVLLCMAPVSINEVRHCAVRPTHSTFSVAATFSLRSVYAQQAMTDEDIVEAFRRGDDRATSALYERYGRLVFTVCLRVLGNRTLAEDATQQTFVQAWKNAHSFDASRQFGPWLATISQRVSIDILRHEQRRIHGSLDESNHRHPGQTDTALTTAGPDAAQIEAVWKVREAIDALPDDDRKLMRLQHLEGVPHSEIAKILGLPLGTVKSRSHRIHRQLAASLRGLNDAGQLTGSGSAEYDRRTTT